MKAFDPIEDIANSQSMLDNGEWPNFHDAEVHNLSIWRDDVRPEDDVWIGPAIEASFESSSGSNRQLALCCLLQAFGYRQLGALKPVTGNPE